MAISLGKTPLFSALKREPVAPKTNPGKRTAPLAHDVVELRFGGKKMLKYTVPEGNGDLTGKEIRVCHELRLFFCPCL
jgi:hypothetical protein